MSYADETCNTFCDVHADLIQLLIFIVALVGLIYKIFKDKRKWPPLLRIMTADLKQVNALMFGVSRLSGFPFLYKI